MATFRSTDSSPKEQFVNHQAGLDGAGGGSYIDTVICREKDANTAWTSASDGVLEERRYYCQNWRADVSAVLTSGGLMVEWVKYSSYGSPFGLPGGDADSSGNTDATDTTQIQTWINTSAYDVRGDINLNGVVNASDKTTVTNNYVGTTLGWNNLSAVGNRKGYAGYEWESQTTGYHVRHRYLRPDLGRWIRRDPLGYVDGPNLYEYVKSMAVRWVDYDGQRRYIHICDRDCNQEYRDRISQILEDWKDCLAPLVLPFTAKSLACHLGCALFLPCLPCVAICELACFAADAAAAGADVSACNMMADYATEQARLSYCICYQQQVNNGCASPVIPTIKCN